MTFIDYAILDWQAAHPILDVASKVILGIAGLTMAWQMHKWEVFHDADREWGQPAAR